MAIQTFSSGQTLTAAQMNALQANDYNQTVSAKTTSYTLVAGDLGTHVQMTASTATTITFGTALFTAGDSIRVSSQGAGVCTLTAGSGFTLTSAGSLALSQYSGGEVRFQSSTAATYFPSAVTVTASGLTLVKTQTIGTAVSSVEVTDAFSSTYDIYKITVTGGVTSAAYANIGVQLGATTTGYYYSYTGTTWAGAANSGNGSNTTAFLIAGSGTTNTITLSCELVGPNLAKNTQINSAYMGQATTAAGNFYGGYLNDSTQYTAFTILASTGTLTGGTIRVYGYQNS